MNNFRIVDCDQRSETWLKERAGKLTASVASDAIAKGKKEGKESLMRADLKIRLAQEIIRGVSMESDYVSYDMKRGIELEPRAREAFEVLCGRPVYTCGFLAHNTLPIGCSLDGYLGDFEELVSFKCPKSRIHLEYDRAGNRVPPAYVAQMHHELLMVPSAGFYNFVSFDETFADELERLQIVHVRVKRDDAAIAEYEQKMLAFLKDVELQVEAFRTMARTRQIFAEAVAS